MHSHVRRFYQEMHKLCIFRIQILYTHKLSSIQKIIAERSLENKIVCSMLMSETCARNKVRLDCIIKYIILIKYEQVCRVMFYSSSRNITILETGSYANVVMPVMLCDTSFASPIVPWYILSMGCVSLTSFLTSYIINLVFKFDLIQKID